MRWWLHKTQRNNRLAPLNYLILSSRSWSDSVHEIVTSVLPEHNFYLVKSTAQLFDSLSSIHIDTIFAPHWSFLIPASVYSAIPTIIFHMTDLPYGRGGSPLQNLIERGHKETMLTAFLCSEKLDSGPILLKKTLSLLGLAEEIYLRSAELSAEMIQRIVIDMPTPQPQDSHYIGDPFLRRNPSQSDIGSLARPSLTSLYDHIRMLDADGYPHAYFDWNGFRFTLTRPALRTSRIEADIQITPIPRNSEASN